MKTYYVLWMPTLKELKAPYICKDVVCQKLEDSKRLGGYHLKGTIDSLLNITIEYSRTGIAGFFKRIVGKGKRVVQLCKESENLKAGFIQYSCELSKVPCDEIERGLSGMMRSPIYHFLKGFFHNHTHHHSSQDSLLQAYVSDTFVDIKSCNVDICTYYIGQYIDLLKDFNAVTPDQVLISKKRINRTHKVRQSINTLGEILKSGNDLKGQLGYMDFLLNKALKPCDIPRALKSDINGLRKDVQGILDETSTYYDVSTAELGVKYGIHGIRWGIAGVSVSIILFACSLILSSKDSLSLEQLMDRKNDALIKEIMEIKETIAKESDSIRKDFKALEKKENTPLKVKKKPQK